MSCMKDQLEKSSKKEKHLKLCPQFLVKCAKKYNYVYVNGNL